MDLGLVIFKNIFRYDIITTRQFIEWEHCVLVTLDIPSDISPCVESSIAMFSNCVQFR